MYLSTGLGASVFAPQGGNAGVPSAAGASAQGPRNIGQQAFGIVGGDSGSSNAPGYAILGGGVLALGLLAFIWWSLPR